MTHPRYDAAGCVLQDGRFAVKGRVGYSYTAYPDGVDPDGDDYEEYIDGEVFDPTVGKWELLPRMLTHARSNHALVVVVGGMVAIGGDRVAYGRHHVPDAELFDVESGRWFALPHTMAVPRTWFAGVVSVPASALAVLARRALSPSH
jgi:hypothetical protein